MKNGTLFLVEEDFELNNRQYKKGNVLKLNCISYYFRDALGAYTCALNDVDPETFKEKDEIMQMLTTSTTITNLMENQIIKILGSVCARCGKKVDGSISDEKNYVCEDCAKNYYEKCEICGKISYFPEVVYFETAEGKKICHSCAIKHCFNCPTCGELHFIENAYKYGELMFCSKTCVDNYWIENSYIREYGDKQFPIFYGEENELKMGVELEIDGGEGRDECVEALSKISGKHYCKEDGSLNYEGIEIVTQPMSLKYHMKNFPWKDICETALDYGYTSDQAGTCGLHIHVDRSYFNDSTKASVELAYLIKKYCTNFIRFSRRFDSQMNWCYISEIDSLYNIEEDYNFMSESRYRAINVLNSKTIEFRLWKGSLNIETIFATLQMTQVLCDIVKEFEEDVEYIKNLTWEDICKYGEKYEELQLYLKRRNLIPSEAQRQIA